LKRAARFQAGTQAIRRRRIPWRAASGSQVLLKSLQFTPFHGTLEILEIFWS
jgi:hypothetical protein